MVLDHGLAAIVADEVTLEDPALAAAAPGGERGAREHHLAQLAERDARGIRDLGQEARRREPRYRVDLEDELVARVGDHHVDAGRAATAERGVGAHRLRERAAVAL